jgi:hypothetical protein
MQMAKPCLSVVCIIVVVLHIGCSHFIANPAQGGRTPLHDAVLRQDIPSVMLLLEGGADVNAQTAVSRANFFASNEWCGLTVTIADDCVQLGQTPLMIAAVAEDIPLMHLLLSAGAKMDVPDEVRSSQFWTCVQVDELNGSFAYTAPAVQNNGRRRSRCSVFRGTGVQQR